MQPEVDVAAMTALLDGRYAEVRAPRAHQPGRHTPTSSTDAETLDTAAFRERVRDVVVEMAATGQTGMGFPDGVRRGRRHRRLDRGLRDPRPRRPQRAGQGRRPVRALRRRDPPARHRAPPRGLPRPARHRRADGLLRDDRDRPRLQRAGPRHHGDVRRRRPASSSSRRPTTRAARTTSATRPRTPTWRWSSPSSRSAASPAGVHAFVVPLREDGAVLPGVRIEDCGRKMGLNGVDNGRIWFDGVRIPRDQPARPVRRRVRGRRLLERDREPQPALLHHARHPRAGPRLRRRRRHQRLQGRARHRGPVRRPPPPVRGHRPAAWRT